LDINLAYTIPIEGSTDWFDIAFIPSDAPHPNNAYLFLDYILRPEVIAAASNYTGYANANRDATALVIPEYADDPAIYPDAAIMKRLASVSLHPPKIERKRTRAWTRAKSGM
jgi:putrescine transport system substrate-binding protein